MLDCWAEWSRADGWVQNWGRNECWSGEFQAHDCAGSLMGPIPSWNPHKPCQPFGSVISTVFFVCSGGPHACLMLELNAWFLFWSATYRYSFRCLFRSGLGARDALLNKSPLYHCDCSKHQSAATSSQKSICNSESCCMIAEWAQRQ